MLTFKDNYYNNIQYKAAIYCRLSREDEGVIQSESIKNQKAFLVKYVREQGWELYNTYIDDGFTGTRFDRPGFKKILQDIEDGNVNLVIVKDLSRLGRDYIDTGYYIEKYFPEKGVRFIAVNDGIDTFQKRSPGNDITPFRSVLNDMYAKDISIKVRSAMDTKKEKGLFIGAFAPFGYMKDPSDKNKLIVDQEAAGIVKRIFYLYIEGNGLSKISHILNEEGVITPTQYKSKSSNYKGTYKKKLWTPGTVKSILVNPTYAGCLTQNKYEKVSYKSKKIKVLPKESWITVEGTHEPIINKQIFEDVQQLMQRKSNKNYQSKKSIKLFSGFIYCGDCGAYMTYHSNGKNSYMICSTYKWHTSKFCTRHSIKEDELKKIVIQDVKKLAETMIDRHKLIQSANYKNNIHLEQHIQKEMKGIEKKIDEINEITKSLYRDKVKGLISEKEFIQLKKEFAHEKDVLEKRLGGLKQQLLDFKNKKNEEDKINKLIEEILNLKVLDRLILEKLISRIEIYEDKRVKITYKFKKPVRTM